MNTLFTYLYRDGGNYKKYGEVVFSGEPGARTAEMMRLAERDPLFIAAQVRIPNVFLFEELPPNGDDHCFHEFFSIEVTQASSDDNLNRSIEEFADEFAAEATKGWLAFDVGTYLE